MKIYVVTHKKIDLDLPNIYECIQVGNAERFASITDRDFDDNISNKNPYYCELTAAYLIYKNIDDQDIVGLAHYRRFFTKNRFSSKTKYILNEQQIRKDLKNYDFITTKLYKTNLTIKEVLLSTCIYEKDLNTLTEIIKSDYPEYYDDYLNLLNGKRSLLLNMMICKKTLWDKYYSWLFPILEKLESKVDLSGYSDYKKRIFGFLAERLFSVFINHNHYTFKSYPVLLVGEPKLRILRQTIGKLFHMRKY